MSGSLNLTENIESQRSIWYIIPLLPVFIIFYICSVAETNRAPFDLAEANKIINLVQIYFIYSYVYINILVNNYGSSNSSRRSMSTEALPPLNLDWVTGFTDAEGCFLIKFSRTSDYNLGWKTQAVFQIKLHKRALLMRGAGTIVKDGDNLVYV